MMVYIWLGLGAVVMAGVLWLILKPNDGIPW
jgi:hypothetical protein